MVAGLEELGLLVKVEDYRHSVPYSDRGKVPVEPLLSTQWFVKTEPLAARCREALEKQDPRFIPERWRRSTATGSPTSATGASAASSGGAIAFLPGS